MKPTGKKTQINKVSKELGKCKQSNKLEKKDGSNGKV